MKNKGHLWWLASISVVALLWAIKSAASWRPQLFGVQKEAYFFAFSPDGKWFTLSEANGAVQMWNIESKRAVWRSDDPGWVFSPDSRLVVMEHKTSPDGHERETFKGTRLDLCDVRTGQVVRSLEPPDSMPFATGGKRPLAFSPDGRELRVATPSSLLCFDVASGRFLKATHWLVPSESFNTTVYDGRFISKDRFVTMNRDLAVFDVTTAKQLQKVPAFFLGSSFDVAPDGFSFLEQQNYGATSVLYRFSDAHLIAKLPQGTTRYSGDGSCVYFSPFNPGGQKEALQVFDAHTGRKLRTLPGLTSKYFGSSPDGNWLYEARGGKIWKWRAL